MKLAARILSAYSSFYIQKSMGIDPKYVNFFFNCLRHSSGMPSPTEKKTEFVFSRSN